jgi:hypothetical protein
MKKITLLLITAITMVIVGCTKEGTLDIEAIEEKLYGEQDLGTYTPSYCTDQYAGPNDNIDIQLNVFCQAAYAYLCLDGLAPDSQEVTGNCAIYNDMNESSTPCPYCQ